MSDLERKVMLHLIHGQTLLMGLLGDDGLDPEGQALVGDFLDTSKALAVELGGLDGDDWDAADEFWDDHYTDDEYGCLEDDDDE